MPASPSRFAFALLTLLACTACRADAKDPVAPPFAQRVKVAPFPEGLTWINTTRPVELSQLRGRFVLLDFWTYCCINCMHILPELKRLERAYPKELVVIGVHSAKFDNEKEAKNITRAVERYGIEHPVINDAEMALWNRFNVHAWPTVLLIDPEGYGVWGQSGEVTFDQLDKVLKRAIPFYRKKGLLDDKPMRLEAAKPDVATPLRFPGKVLADEPGDRLFIADSNHNRIVVTHLDGSARAVIGRGGVDTTDGDYATAQFNHPQGLALAGQRLFVADTENHAIRCVDLTKQTVATVAGRGQQSRESPPLAKPERPLATALNSPWDLCVHGEYLYIAMAGSHQLWRMTLDGRGIEVYAGNGREDVVDGPLRPRRAYELGAASFAQPSGLATDGQRLFVADSEGSSIRVVPVERGREVTTLVGTAGLDSARLFTFGDVDGRRDAVRLQHPLGVTWYEGRLYVADSYNHKIKVIDPADGTTRTLAGAGKPGGSDEPPLFNEPAGLAAAAGKLFVADTNNHLLRVIDLRHGNRVSTLAVK